jgi:hypothetical protein
MRAQPYVPDFILVQDGTCSRRQTLENALARILGTRYAYVDIGDRGLDPSGYNEGNGDWCPAAVYWRTGGTRFSDAPTHRVAWRGYGWNDQTNTLEESERAAPAVAIRIHDRIANRYLVLGSFKMSHAGGNECEGDGTIAHRVSKSESVWRR